jgi:hypothetical protein
MNARPIVWFEMFRMSAPNAPIINDSESPTSFSVQWRCTTATSPRLAAGTPMLTIQWHSQRSQPIIPAWNACGILQQTNPTGIHIAVPKDYHKYRKPESQCYVIISHCDGGHINRYRKPGTHKYGITGWRITRNTLLRRTI